MSMKPRHPWLVIELNSANHCNAIVVDGFTTKSKARADARRRAAENSTGSGFLVVECDSYYTRGRAANVDYGFTADG